MTDFLQSVIAGLNQCGIRLEQGLVLAVSGGADSVALLLAVREILAQGLSGEAAGEGEGVELPRTPVIAHVDHGLREDSAIDADFVCELAGAIGWKYEQKTLTADDWTWDAGESKESRARHARYRFLEEVALRHDCCFIATAHHADDQTETILHNFLRGTGLRGMAGIPRLMTRAAGVQVVRPLVDIPREMIELWLEVQGQPWRTDSSNQSTEFTRNRIRHELIPWLRENFQPGVERRIRAFGEYAQEAVRELDRVADRLLANACHKSAGIPGNTGARDGDAKREAECGEVLLCCEQLSGETPFLLGHLFSRLWSHQGWPLRTMTRRHWKRLAQLVSEEKGAIDFPGRVRAVRRGSLLVLRHVPDPGGEIRAVAALDRGSRPSPS